MARHVKRKGGTEQIAVFARSSPRVAQGEFGCLPTSNTVLQVALGGAAWPRTVNLASLLSFNYWRKRRLDETMRKGNAEKK